MAEVKRDWEDRSQGKLTEAQRKMLCACCGDLSKQLAWQGHRMDRDSWRHFFAGIVSGQKMVPGWDYGDGRPRGFIFLGKSSLSLTRAEASDAITMAITLGDDPSSQGIDAKPVRWSDAVLLGMGFNPRELEG